MSGENAERVPDPKRNRAEEFCREFWNQYEPIVEAARRAILAGTSAKGCCQECGAGWVRVVDVKVNTDGRKNAGERHGSGYAVGRLDARGKCPSGLQTDSQTLGWQPACTCNAGDPIPCTVLDPFLGSGTTIAVARQLGRNGIGCELNPEYVKLAKDRIGKAEKPHTYASEKVVDSPLFGAST